MVPERWRTAWNPNAYKFEAAIKKGVKTPIRIEWQPDGDVSYCGLRVAAPRSEAEKNQLSIWSEMSPDMDYYFIAGQNLDEVISGYRTLTGKASLYPKWTLGFWQSRERYQSSKDIEENLKKFRDLKSQDELFQTCDIVSLHIPATPETIKSIDYKTVNQLPKGGILINTAR